ncbi:MAG: sugar ABC transporter substrate-binding protein [Acetobacteraceae bacterium]|nr:sugar ABC transporter substrate-binding protein [Acetobacteraceae bacterium]
MAHSIGRRTLLAGTAGAALAAAAGRRARAQGANAHMGIDTSNWTPDYIRSIAGTQTFDTAADCAKIVPLSYKGRLTYWYNGPNQASPQIEHQIDTEFWAAFAKTYPNIQVDKQNLDYNQMLDKLRTAALGNAAPMVAKMPIMWGVEFAAKGQLKEFGPHDIGYTEKDFWPGALKSVTWDDKLYGVPTNNETMALIWNSALFKDAGLPPDQAPASWDDLVAYAKQIKDKTGKNGYGLVARVNAGNTPFRYMPQLWAYGGGALDEASEHPTYKKIEIDNDGSKKSLAAAYTMYNVDHSAPVSALTNTQTENENPFLAGQLGMMIGHPAEYAAIIDLAKHASGPDKDVAQHVIDSTYYGLIPKGAARRAAVFGGSNDHVFSADVVDGKLDLDAARAFIAFSCSPEWSTKLAWDNSNPGTLLGFKTIWMKQRLEQIKFLEITSSMLPYGIPFPVVPQATEIMNIIVPNMLQNALTKKMTVDAACANAAGQIRTAMQNV